MPELLLSQETTDYLARLTPYLSHLRYEEQAELLEELAIHLESVCDVAEASGDSVVLDRLVGSPESFVAEYCETAGIPFASGPERVVAEVANEQQTGPLTGLLTWLLGRLDAMSSRVAGREKWRAFVGFVPELAPAWWVARAVLLTMVLGELFGGDGATRIGSIPVPRLFGSTMFGMVFATWLATKSVAFGRRKNKPVLSSVASVGVGAICFLAFATIAFAAADSHGPVEVVYGGAYPPIAESVVEQGFEHLASHDELYVDRWDTEQPNAMIQVGSTLGTFFYFDGEVFAEDGGQVEVPRLGKQMGFPGRQHHLEPASAAVRGPDGDWYRLHGWFYTEFGEPVPPEVVTSASNQMGS